MVKEIYFEKEQEQGTVSENKESQDDSGVAQTFS